MKADANKFDNFIFSV